MIRAVKWSTAHYKWVSSAVEWYRGQHPNAGRKELTATAMDALEQFDESLAERLRQEYSNDIVLLSEWFSQAGIWLD